MYQSARGKRTAQVFPVVKKENMMCGGSRRMNVYMCVCIDLVCCADHSTLSIGQIWTKAYI